MHNSLTSVINSMRRFVKLTKIPGIDPQSTMKSISVRLIMGKKQRSVLTGSWIRIILKSNTALLYFDIAGAQCSIPTHINRVAFVPLN